MKKILINSVPKSGTNLLVQIAQGIPGIHTKQSMAYTWTKLEEILALRQNELMLGHIAFSTSLSQELHSHSIHHLFIYRDLRDVAVSLVYYINQKLYTHPLYFVFQNRSLTFEQQLNAVILGTDFTEAERGNAWGLSSYPGIVTEFQNIYEWRNDPFTCSVRYEDLVRDEASRNQAILQIIGYLWRDLQATGFSQAQLLQLMKQNINPQKSGTFRKGKAGSWKQEFTQENKRNFKQVAGHFLMELGYEQNLDW